MSAFVAFLFARVYQALKEKKAKMSNESPGGLSIDVIHLIP